MSRFKPLSKYDKIQTPEGIAYPQACIEEVVRGLRRRIQFHEAYHVNRGELSQAETCREMKKLVDHFFPDIVRSSYVEVEP